jgi:hypothetical protein
MLYMVSWFLLWPNFSSTIRSFLEPTQWAVGKLRTESSVSRFTLLYYGRGGQSLSSITRVLHVLAEMQLVRFLGICFAGGQLHLRHVFLADIVERWLCWSRQG